MPDPRPTLKPITQGMNFDDVLKSDIVKLIADPSFLRFMFASLEQAGMYHGSFHAEVGASQWSEGRRQLGFDMLGRLTEVSADAHLRIMTSAQPYKEAPNGRRTRNRTDRNADGYVSGDNRDTDQRRDAVSRDDRTVDYGSD